jgi:hypothetical protein
MPMERDKHEEILGKLLQPDLSQTDRTELLQSLRVDYNSVIDDHKTLTESNAKFKSDNDDLVVANSKLFRERGFTSNEDKKKEDAKSFSETVTIEQMEKGMN